MIGGLVMAVLNSGLMLLGVGQDKTSVIKGLVLLAAVAFDVYNKQQGRPSIIGRLTGGTRAPADAPAAVAAANQSTADAVPSAEGPVVTSENTLPTSNPGI